MLTSLAKCVKNPYKNAFTDVFSYFEVIRIYVYVLVIFYYYSMGLEVTLHHIIVYSCKLCSALCSGIL